MEMKDEAVALNLDMPKAKVWEGAYYGNMNLPHPTNEKAKMVNHHEVMRETNEGK